MRKEDLQLEKKERVDVGEFEGARPISTRGV